MRSIVIILLAFVCCSLVRANDVNISTVTKDGNTFFYLQAGAYNLEKDAKIRQNELAKLVDQKVEIKNLADKHLYLVQIGPIDDYQTARALKEKLSQKTERQFNQINKNQTSSLEVSQLPKNMEQAQTAPPGSKLWNLRNADIRAVIAEVSRITGKNFVIDPRVQGKVSIVSSTPLSSRELYQVFLSVLQVSGYAAIPNGEIIKIIPNIDAKTQSPDLLSGMKSPPRGDDMMVAVIPVHYVPSEQLVPVLRPLMPQWSSVSAYAPSNMLILSGRANNIKSLAEIIKQVDSSSANGIDMVRLHHALAMDVANTLKDLVKTQPGIGSRTQITIAADDRSNSILVSGSKTDRIRLRMLILKLDKDSSTGVNSNTQVVYLNYLRAEDLVPILAGIAQANFSGNVGTTIGTITRPALDSTNPASSLANTSADGQSSSLSSTSTSSAPMNASGATANTTSASTQNEGSTKPTVQIIGEPNTNSIILNAPASIIRTLKTVISQLDIKPAQLLIEALVAEVDEKDVNNLGIEWGSNQQTGNPKDFRPGFAIINSKTRIDDFQAQIYALAREQRANILSTPSVVVLDNRQAKILIGKQVSIATTSYPNNAGGTTTASPFTTFDRVNVALHLYVRPQITRGQGIQLQIDQGNDTLDPATSTTDNTTTPTFNISSIVTSVHVESGDVVVLGGLIQDSIGNDNNKLPILGDIPGIGRLFQRNIRNRDKRVLMVFIKPIILRNERDNLHVTGEKYNYVRQYQLDWIRSQEAFEQTDDETVLPPLTQGNLPVPFSTPPQYSSKMTK
ncbi:TPA: type II protein secretion LspD [Legionella pneumophila subsp. pneumophila]|uniref:GspD family T2SS secretin variant LspD n=2 Tax=Legionella pneumophila TaxID=446 RepID=A0AAN5R557_LEGPN|nr:GspD family T2SS secretin variant LspD [Legionella pneumophila]AOW52130.1 type II protein secretion LspD [Legionella pneumophila subsp. pneumophila]AOW54279.1 type II protein secretion LspD [Legionella pneumophila subsp. pneumophila]AOW57428.1 type II protein secretion LspD [Legionella pneumophila subsp. pneumophila]AOW62394.1 type II protein secretion LspD [Legionella pneumophila subsp. pneumophila]AOW62925.1 type II protein secretion LspD [Legionella pneumophila subsp. pneumophila]